PTTSAGYTNRPQTPARPPNPQPISTATTPPAGYVGCSASQQQQVSSAANVAQKLAGDAAAYLAAHTSATPRFTTWFGSYTPARRSTVLSHFRSISQTQFATLTYDC